MSLAWKTTPRKPDFRSWYTRFNTPVTPFDCGTLCAPDNPSGKPFCCDICHAVPAAYKDEWDYLQSRTDLWHVYRGDECTSPADQEGQEPIAPPDNMIFLACLGPALCQRDYRAISCRQFPFFPYVTDDYRFLGLAIEWQFENTCWVLRHLDQVTRAYRLEFVAFYDELFSLWPDEMESYAMLSEEMRDYFASRHRRFPLLHRNGRDYLVSPRSGKMCPHLW